VRGLLDAPGCLGATFGASLTNLVALDEDNYADILTYPSSGFPTQTAHAFSLQAFMGHNAAFGSQGSRLLLNLHNGPTTGSSIYCQLLLTSAGALTLPIRGNPCPPLRTPSIPDGLVPTSGVFQPPGAAAPFVTGYYAELTTQGGLYNNRYAAFVAASVETFRYAPCPEPSAALADDESPALRAARREFARQLALATCFGCGDSGEGLA
jgi:hypothetical protein